jgi:O-antigen/teichoic acid export membrane protein
MLRDLLKDSAVYAIPSFISRGLSLILIPLYTRVLSPSDFGSLDLLIVFASIVNLTIALEVSQGVARFYASESDPEQKILYVSSAFWFTFGCYAVFLGVALLLSGSFAELIMGQAGLQLVFQIGLGYIFFNGIFYLIQNQFRWEQRSIHYAIVSLTMAFVTAGVSVWLLYLLQWGLVGLLVGMLSGSVVGTALGLWWLRSSFKFRFSSVHLKKMLKFSTPLVFSGTAVWVSLYVDKMMINHFLTIDEVGLYGIGYRLASIATLVIVGIQGALTPLIYVHYQDPNTPRKLEKIFRIFLFFALLIFLFLTLFASDILLIMTTQDFYGASIVVVFLVPAILLGNMYIFSPGISIANKTYLIVWINVAGGLINFGLNYWLIPVFGISGAGMATLLSYGGIFAAHTLIGQRFYPIHHNWLPIFAAVCLAALIAVMLPLWILPDHIRWMGNVFALIGFSLFAPAVGLIKRDEILLVWRFVSQRISFKV